MKFFAVLFTLCWSLLALSEDALDVRFLMTQRSAGNPMGIPIKINANGDVSFFGSTTDNLIFKPNTQLGFSRVTINYSQPVILNRFNLYPQQKDLGWIEIKRFRIEGGLGLAAVIQQATTVGLVPYKGAMNTIIRHKTSREDESLPFKMPKKLADLREWNTNDLGTFQTYGGVTAYAGFKASVVNVATITIGIQNQFIVEMKKNNEESVILKITEEDLKRRQLVLGQSPIKAAFAQFKGKRFSYEFTLDLNNPDHHKLFEEALDGNIQLLQESLETTSQKLTWQGTDRTFYVGIPAVLGRSLDAGHYDLEDDGVEAKLDYTGSRTRGFLAPMKNLSDFVYQTDNAMMIVWSSEMNKVDKRAFEKRFLSIGRIIGIKGFNREVPDDTAFGSVVSQIAVHVTKKEIEAVEDINLEEVGIHLRNKCEVEQLTCRKDWRFLQIMDKLKELKGKPWDEMKRELGLLIIKEPAIIHAVVKTMKYKKEVYFKFLSEKFQSLEGSSAIEL